MKAAIMQPYFLPYIGYFQLLATVDRFVLYDDIEYTKRGWINRNRLLRDGAAITFSLPLKKASDYLDVRERELAAEFDRDKLLNRFKGAYGGAPYFGPTFALLEEIMRCEDINLFDFLRHSIRRVCEVLKISTRILISSDVAVDRALRSEDRVLATCHAIGAGTYVNSTGGMTLYSRARFASQNIQLKFLRSMPREYPQFGCPFVSHLSIIDTLMFNPIDAVRASLDADYEVT